ncbi:2-oxoglutarate-dependent ethylene/succinate-forming enzyme [Metarhizium guizhouense ARSEF 977]|uniref:2-oxoglutarate-dependent ethylene/succinate-forming enzyme n=1 Tax=Metarhizium guizhouense (strain ARSEF 977) TaxID=1276136 RepID=A0A0B4G961_METGA|nr:2-oxoglutarate-dependent ethylene/succinate-forming enzyme [Metarhizium guizhouense ARSEF 977]
MGTIKELRHTRPRGGTMLHISVRGSGPYVQMLSAASSRLGPWTFRFREQDQGNMGRLAGYARSSDTVNVEEQ